MLLQTEFMFHIELVNRAVFTWLSKGIGFGFGFTTPFGWLVYLLWFFVLRQSSENRSRIFTCIYSIYQPHTEKNLLISPQKTKDKSTELTQTQFGEEAQNETIRLIGLGFPQSIRV